MDDEAKKVKQTDGGVFSARLEALIQQPKCSEESQTTDNGLEKQLESQYLIVNGTVYKNFSESNINEDIISKVSGLDSSDIISVTIPTCVNKIDKGAFFCSRHLEEITIPSSVTTIEFRAFYKCTNLKKVDLGKCDKLESIDFEAFAYCYNLAEIDFSNCVSLEFCHSEAFYNCSDIRILDFSKCIKLHLKVLNIPQNNLKKLVLPPGQWSFNEMFLWDCVDTSHCKNVKVVLDEAFQESGIKEIEIIDSVEIIGEYLKYDAKPAFYNSGMLRTIVMPASLKEIKGCIVKDMEQLKKIDFSKVKHLKTIPKRFIYYCPKLKELIIPQGVTDIEDDAFEAIHHLKRLFLPPTLKTIGDLELKSLSIYCFSPSLEELEPIVYGWDDDNDDEWDEEDLEDLDEEALEELKEEKKKIKINLFVLPQYLDKYIAQRKAERIPEDVLIIQEIPEEYRYYYDN